GCWTPHVEITRPAFEVALDVFQHAGLITKRHRYEDVVAAPPAAGAMSEALAGTRVVDLTNNQAGPSCGQMLAWLGADVVKVEEPGRGDIARHTLRDRPDSDSLFYLSFNANKRSLTLNLKHPRGQEVFRTLLGTADVL